MYICCIEKNKKTQIELQFRKDFFSIYFIESLNEENLKEIKELFSPFFSKNNRLIKISYIYIKNMYADNRLLKFTLHNPISKSIVSLIFNNFKYKKSLSFSEIKIQKCILPSIVLDINKKFISLTEKKISDFINIILLLYQIINIDRKYSKIIDGISLKAFNFGKKYYENRVKDLKINEKNNRRSMGEETFQKINTFINNLKTEKERENKDIKVKQIEKINKNNSKIGEDEKEKSNPNKIEDKIEDIDKIEINNNLKKEEYNPSLYNYLEIDLIIKRDLFHNYENLKKFEPEIITKTSYFIEITINLIFKVFNIDKSELGNIYDYMNKGEKGNRLNSTNNNINAKNFKMKEIHNDTIEQEKIFKQNNSTYQEKQDLVNIENIIKKYNSQEPNIKKENENINELLDFSKKFHSFVPNNSMQNILINTSQLIHRKFFEILFKIYFSDIIDIEVEKNKALSSDAFHQILLVLRRLKKILFTNRNINYYNEFLFLNEQ